MSARRRTGYPASECSILTTERSICALLNEQHSIPCREPLVGVVVVLVLLKVRSAVGEVDKLGVIALFIFVDEIVPGYRNTADQVIALKPLELMKLQPSRTYSRIRERASGIDHC